MVPMPSETSRVTNSAMVLSLDVGALGPRMSTDLVVALVTVERDVDRTVAAAHDRQDRLDDRVRRHEVGDRGEARQDRQLTPCGREQDAPARPPVGEGLLGGLPLHQIGLAGVPDRKSTRLNSSHVKSSYAV